MKIIEHQWISTSAREALLTVECGEHRCAVFSQPCNSNIGDIISEPLLAISASAIFKTKDNSIVKIIRSDNNFAHEIIAIVEDRGKQLVSVGSIVIEIDDELPGDIKQQDYIQFECNRLDLMI